MRLSVPILAAFSLLTGTSHAWSYLTIPLGGGSAASAPAPAPAPVRSCNPATLQFKPLGSFLFGNAFPNPWSGIHVPLSVPNCAPAGPPPPPCPAGQSCQAPPALPTYPAAQAAGDAICAGARGSLPFALRACLDNSGVAVNCCPV